MNTPRQFGMRNSEFGILAALLLVLSLLLCLVPAALGAEIPTATPVPPSELRTPTSGLPPNALLITVLVPVLLALAKKLFPQIKPSVLPLVAPVLGALLEYGLSRIGLDGGGTVTGAVAGGAGVGLREIVDQGRKSAGINPATTACLGFLCCLLFFASGCAGFSNHQRDISVTTLPDGTREERTITSQQRAHTVFDSKSALAQLKAQQTDKVQSIGIGSLNQESTAPNLGAMLGVDLLVRLLSTPEGKTALRAIGIPVP